MEKKLSLIIVSAITLLTLAKSAFKKRSDSRAESWKVNVTIIIIIINLIKKAKELKGLWWMKKWVNKQQQENERTNEWMD